MPSNPRKQLNSFLSEIVIDGGRVGDVGCSNKPNSDKCAIFNPDEYIRFDINGADEILDLDKQYLKYQGYFDILFCTEVFEHLTNPLQGAETLYKMLKPGGILYFSVVFIYAHHGENDYLRYTDYGINEIFSRAGFSDIEIRERVAKNPSLLKMFYDDEGMHSPELRSPDYGYPVAYFARMVK